MNVYLLIVEVVTVSTLKVHTDVTVFLASFIMLKDLVLVGLSFYKDVI